MVQNPPTPIPTTWRGVEFRSRLEARWAAVFHSLGWNWQYEPQTFPLDVAPYTPDFWIDEIGAHVEIKPLETIDHRWPHFARQYGPLHVIEGHPPTELWRLVSDAYSIKTYDTLHVDRPMMFGALAACNACRHVYVSRPGCYCPRGCQRRTVEHDLNITDIRLARAFQFSRDQVWENS